MSRIHPSAVVDPRAEIDSSVEIGPFCTVGPHVKLGASVVLRNHVNVSGHTEIGPGTVAFSFASIGDPPQDLKYRGEPTRLVVGARNTIREHVTLHPGTESGGSLTSVGDDNLLMVGSHVAHDCHVGNHVVLSNHVMLAGHVTVEDHAVIMGGTGVQQFLRIGESAMVAGLSGVIQDVCPFAVVQGYPARVLRLNRVNLERRGFAPERIDTLERAFRVVFKSKAAPKEILERLRAEFSGSADVEHIASFLEKSQRGFARMR